MPPEALIISLSKNHTYSASGTVTLIVPSCQTFYVDKFSVVLLPYPVENITFLS
jgi:hypothetical protein